MFSLAPELCLQRGFLLYIYMNQEVNELNLLLNRGVQVTLRYKEDTRKSWQFWRKKSIKTTERKLVFKEPTLAVLDRVSLEILNLDFDEKKILSDKSSVVIEEGRRIAYKSCKTLARIIAIFALGENLFVNSKNGIEEDSQELEKLTKIILLCIEPSKMEKLISCLTSLSNIVSFINSIRLLTAARTTRSRIECEG